MLYGFAVAAWLLLPLGNGGVTPVPFSSFEACVIAQQDLGDGACVRTGLPPDRNVRLPVGR